jgi:small subunit ribosomal protein S17
MRKKTKMDSKKTRRMGKVLSDTPEKTIIVGVSWSQKDRLYKKSSRRLTKLVAHDPKEEAKVGDNVIVEFSKPISKTKKWKLIEVIN